MLKYAKRPVCLRCGYDIHVQLRREHACCPECGQACELDDLAEQIAWQRYDRTPVLMDALSGVLLLIMLPPLLLIGNAVVLLLLAPFFQEDVTIVVYLTSLVILLGWLAMMVLSVYDMRLIYGSMYGIWIWLLTHVYVLIYMLTVSAVTVWLGMIAGWLIDRWFYPNQEPWQPPIAWAWLHAGGVLCIGLFFLNRWWSTRYVILPCRKRCRALAMEQLGLRAWERDDSPPPSVAQPG